MIRKKHYKYLFSFLIFFALAFFAKVAGAQLDIGVDAVNDSINLSSDDPRSIAARVINVAMLFLSVLAVGVVLVGGFKWMTSNGDENKVSEAKRLLKNGVIGLTIILASWGITVFVMNQLLGATGNSGSASCDVGTSCGCGGSLVEDISGACVCQGSDCSTLPNPPCDSNKSTPQCEVDNSLCSTGSYCDDSCICQPESGLGEPCDAEPSLASCQAQESKCSAYLTCDAVNCLCQGAPVITEISPVGGFCEDNYQACQADSDCTAEASCNTENPNGTAGNFVSIFGYNFADFGTNSGVSFINLDTNQEVIAQFPNTGDLAICGNNYWQDQQIIVLVPSGLTLGDSYAIKVIRHLDNNSNYSNIDISNDANGPQIPNFIYNNIARPGLCNINPSEEFVQKPLIFTGAGFNSDIEMNFGVYANPIAGLDQKYVSHNQIKGKLPNLVPGNISTFVRQSVDSILQNSNYLRFTVLDDSKYSRYITDFEPLSGPVGTYVTIRGNGFGRIQGKNNVYFVDSDNKVLADYDFPSVCANSFWSDKQVIVKVPEGLNNKNFYHIEIDLKDQDDYVSSKNLVPPNDTFESNLSAPLSPGLCKMEPIRGQVGTEVSLWGEYFGDNQEKDAKAVFYSQSESNPSTVIAAGTGKDTSQKIITKVPGSTASGPAVVENLDNNQVSNSLNFSVGVCQEDVECGTQICCPQGSYKEGICAGSLGDCSSSSLSSVFQWRFSTAYSNLVITDYYSCNGWAQALGTCQTGKLCPNAPGQCSPFNPYTNNQPEGNCCANGFSYSKDLKTCLKDGASCDLPFRASVGNPLIVCSEFETNVYHWLVVSAVYPALPASDISSWINLGNNRYTDSTDKTKSTCTVCSDDYSCVDDGGSDNRGVCAGSLLCAGGASCRADASGNYQCYSEASCQCCCQVGQEVRDCCQGLVCGGSCGADTNSSFDKTSGLGRCSGCKTAGGTQADWDAACSCSGHSGQYCETSDTDFPTGFCTDCSELSEQNCRDHSSVCCFDEKNDICRGGAGNLVASNPGSCAYYACDASDPPVCASGNPLIKGPYTNIASCEAGCPQDGGDSYCSKITAVDNCRNDSACCWDYKINKCSGGDDIESGDDAGYCDYYSCDDCSTAGKDLTFASSKQCIAQCATSQGSGNSCTNAFGDGKGCNAFACGTSSQCLLSDGTVGGTDDNDCGACCCQVSDSSACTDLNTALQDAGDTSVKLTCQANQAPCTGNNRGLCCGCSADNQCGNKVAVGCDSGTCCRARPDVLASATLPKEQANDVCRNAMIKVSFNQAMDVTTFTDNILLLEEKEAGSSCPTGTFVAQNEFDSKKSNFLARIWYSVKSFSQRILGLAIKQDSALADFSPDNNKVYCSIPGLVSNDQGDNYSIIFKPQRLLSANAVHYIIVKGDADLNSASGVMSAWGVGFNGRGLKSGSTYTEGDSLSFNGINYKNSYISAFKTLPSSSSNSGICLIDHVRISPSSYLFQTTEPDLNEDDSKSNAASFDTKADNDRVFSAYALSVDNQIIKPTPSVYNWTWGWSVDDTSVVYFNASVVGLENDKKLVEAKSGVTDDNALIKATVNMDGTNTAGTLGDGEEGIAPVYVFTCANPWPAVAGNNTWLPWSDDDSCILGTGACNDYNYSFYYCRDAGQPGTADDLPAINKNPVQRGGSLVCSISGTACSSAGEPCSNEGGVCILDILKESYFFRAARPGLVSIISLEDKEIGGTIAIQWQSQKEVPYNGANVDVSAYKIYYGLSGGAMTSKLIDADQCSISGSNYVCNETISGLTDNQTYVFRVTALTADNAESQLSAPVSIVPTDKTPPPAPIGFGAGN